MEYFKHLFIRPLFEKLAKKNQFLLGLIRSIQHPELHQINMEPLRIDQLLKRVIRKSSNFIDIGCYIGSMLSEIVHLSPSGTHLGFEAIPIRYICSKGNFQK